MEQYELPVVFSPPRDGIQLTEPLPVAGNMHDGDGEHPCDATEATTDESSEAVVCEEGGKEEDGDNGKEEEADSSKRSEDW